MTNNPHTAGFFNKKAVRAHAIERATIALRRTVLHQLDYVDPEDIRRVLQQIIETDLRRDGFEGGAP